MPRPFAERVFLLGLALALALLLGLAPAWAVDYIVDRNETTADPIYRTFNELHTGKGAGGLFSGDSITFYNSDSTLLDANHFILPDSAMELTLQSHGSVFTLDKPGGSLNGSGGFFYQPNAQALTLHLGDLTLNQGRVDQYGGAVYGQDTVTIIWRLVQL